uniref:Large ribosomal subunit protein mL53 n=1 Tax=Mesocestoides corti TaxID=53468 RepID=A0A5K3F903_MESCO
MVSFKRARGLLPIVKYFRTPLALNDLNIDRTFLQQVNLKPVKSIEFTFNPFFSRTYSIRHVSTLLISPRWRSSNENCIMRVNVRSDKFPPQMQVVFINGNILIVKTENLSDREVLECLMTECSKFQ